MKHLFSFLLFSLSICSLFSMSIATDSCAISIDYVVNYDCSDPDSTIALISVDAVNACSSEYQIFQNGNLVDTKAYGNGSDTIMLADNFGTNALVVCDLENQSCCDTLNVNTSCVCAIYELEYEFVNCVDIVGAYSLLVDMEHIMTSDSFELGGSGNDFGNFAFADLPVTIGPFNESDGSFELAAFDLLDPFCFDFIQIDTIVECPIICSIENLFGEAYECDDNDEVYFDFEFDSGNQTGEFVVMIDSIAIDTFSYGETTYTAGPIDYNCDFFTLLTIIDLTDSSCGADFLFPEIICCDPIPVCSIDAFFLNAEDCDADSNFAVSFTFEPGEGNSDSFYLELNENIVATFAYGDTLYNYSEFPGDCETEYKFLLRDQDDESCFSNFALLGVVCCESIDSCSIRDLTVDVLECNDAEEFMIEFEFIHENTPSDSFVVSGNGNIYNTLPYGLDTYFLGPFLGDCSTIYEFVVQDLVDPNCQTVFEFEEPICCAVDSCTIQNLVVEAQACDADGNFLVDISFEANDPTSDYFYIQNSATINADTFFYGETSYTVGPFAGDCSTLYEFTVIDGTNELCQAEFEFDEPICCDTTVCQISDLFVEAQGCDDNGNFQVVFEFEDNGINSGQFVIRGNGTIYDTLDYGMNFYTVGPLSGDCTTLYEFIVHDLDEIECQAEFVFDEPICCDTTVCDITNLVVEASACDGNGNFIVDFDFDYTDVNSGQFVIRGNGVIYDTFPYGLDSVYTIGPLSGDCTTLYEFIVHDVEDENCQAEFVFTEPVCCDTTACQIDVLEWDWECSEGEYLISVFLDYSGSSDWFNVFDSGDFIGSYMYEDGEFEIGPYEDNGGLFTHNFSFVDISGMCEAELIIDSLACIPNHTADFDHADYYSIQNDQIIFSDSQTFDNIKLFDLNGRLVVDKQITNESIDISTLTTGIYIIEIRLDGNRSSKLFFKL